MSRYALTDEEIKQDITLNKDVIRLTARCLVIDEEGVLTLNEDLIDIPKRPSKVEKDKISEDKDNETDDVAEEEKEETDNTDEENNEENEEEDELLYEEDQAADCVQNGQNVIPSNDEIITGKFKIQIELK
ncbi:hypothetical protein MFLAVUS_004335 [Mucor flavus]|uniref:Uncharacterized protein n=1 Tax=Mucor flavus TaxID=439312 RepID=A0ABP9YVN7_9FUNG